MNGALVGRTVRTALANHLEQYGLDIGGPHALRDLEWENPAHLRLTHPLGSQRFCAVLTDSPTLTRVLQLEQPAGDPLLILAGSIHPRSAHELRSAGIQFLDGAGNAYVRFGGVLIDVRGRRPDPATVQDRRTVRPSAGLFTPRRAQVIFSLLSWPELLESPVRTLAAAAKVSLGQAQSTLKLLDEQGFLNRRSKRLMRREVLTERWADAYATGLGPKTMLQTFHGDPAHLDLVHHGVVYVGGEQSTPWITNPETATLYVEDLSPRMIFDNRWRTDGPANIMVHTVFWAPPDHEMQPPSSFPAPVPPLLVYADLKAAGEPRQLEAAQHVRDSHAHLWHS